eukprot:935499_1
MNQISLYWQAFAYLLQTQTKPCVICILTSISLGIGGEYIIQWICDVDLEGTAKQAYHGCVLIITQSIWLCFLHHRFAPERARRQFDLFLYYLRFVITYIVHCRNLRVDMIRVAHELNTKYCTNDCRICHELFANGDGIWLLQCAHSYHKDCVNGWKEHQLNRGDIFSCPLCGATVLCESTIETRNR